METWVAAVIGAVAGVVVAPLIMQRWPRQGKWGIHPHPVQCPECGAVCPRVRWPTSWRQALWGGWTCKHCGCEMDKYGKKMA